MHDTFNPLKSDFYKAISDFKIAPYSMMRTYLSGVIFFYTQIQVNKSKV